jgi:hypothetical protein
VSGYPATALATLRPQVLQALPAEAPGLAVAEACAPFAGRWAPGTIRIVLETLERDGLAVSEIAKSRRDKKGRLKRHYRRTA